MDQQGLFQEPGAKHTGMLETWLAGMMVTERVTPLARRSGSGETEVVLRVILFVLFPT